MFCARTGAELSSWQIPFSCFFFAAPPLVSILAKPFGVAMAAFSSSCHPKEEENSNHISDPTTIDANCLRMESIRGRQR
jgi:hypothetical protein